MRLFPLSSSGSTSQTCTALVLSALLGAQVVQAQTGIPFNVRDPKSVKNAAKTVAEKMVSFYTGWRPGDVPGNLPAPYYWWQAGAMFGGLIDYWYYTGDDQFNDITMQAILHQVGENKDFQPRNQSQTSGNDDQGFWGMTAMTAAEDKFPNPPADQPQWLALAQAVFHTQAERWYNETCNGGLKWSINTLGTGYYYKNAISNGCFFNLAARLARYTGNETYARWADSSWNWVSGVGIVGPRYEYFDGVSDSNNENCTKVNHIPWTYNTGVYMSGIASMYNMTTGKEQAAWKQRLEGTIKQAEMTFLPESKGRIMTEIVCEDVRGEKKCNEDQRSFRAYLSRWMGSSVKLAPFTKDLIMPMLERSAQAAAKQCSGPDNACGLRWSHQDKWDGDTGVGEQMSALEVIQNNLVDLVSGPADEKTGISKGDPNAGRRERDKEIKFSHITTGDKVGAGFVTSLILLSILGGAWWMIS
ncbi:mannan endo-1,6-alpha-mannosidase [[Emmonsia] crescens]|uniref:Mannan endo-1,6-alpha-mannosidase n=1 Tax=[Emmonsia] crescens TaxID=73230 RepID=A0A2B7Z5X3_9EURO|nr:mannan endo-1,6-alpha-mannosidase [Emmonsia crescens]